MHNDVATQVGRLLEAVDGLRGDVDRIEQKVDLAARDGDVKRIEEKVDKTNGRVRRLELWKAGIVGALAILGWLIANNVDPGVVQGAFPP